MIKRLGHPVIGGLLGATIILVVWLSLRGTPPEFDAEEQSSIEAWSTRKGISLDASRDVHRQFAVADTANRGISDEVLREALTRYEGYLGDERIEVARWTSAMLIDLISNLSPAQIELTREPLQAMVLEFWDQPKFSWELFVVARSLDLHTDPLIDEFAREAIVSENIPVETRNFIRRVMFETPDREDP